MEVSPEVSAEVQARAAECPPRIGTPGWHVVEIIGRHYDPPGRRQNIVFDLRNAAGEEQTVRFGIRAWQLEHSPLLSFFGAALHWPESKMGGSSFHVANAKAYTYLIGRKIAVELCDDQHGRVNVVDWAPVPLTEGPPAADG